MGKGDKKTRKGKITKGSFGVSRPKNKKVQAEEKSPKKNSNNKATPKKSK
ncbi:MAG: 30S ribosomal protein THX [Cyclobacteriaceae bacterium]|nr:30S ribosomal protein THX [Cyclobacteriaceae bacterium]